MCGIASVFAYHRGAPPVEREELMRMRDSMAARGPDGEGLWVSDPGEIGLAHRRLSIIDLTDTAHQPMAIADGRYRIIFNGEIYNYQALRRDLEGEGCRFHSTSDTEVLLQLYAKRGPNMVHALRGMFAFTIWDKARRGLFLARDPFGIKPLYMHDDGKTFRCASQVKALLAGGGIGKEVEPAGHVGFFLWGSVPEPYTLYRDIFAMPAGHTLWVDENGPRAPQAFFDVADALAHAAEESTQEPVANALQAALRDSLRHHLIADVPVGAFLSSGVDSGTLVALASEQTPHTNAITLGFKEYA
ncbi:MAG TPA: asparagine synthase (glutamine-hydrolyzing), partial [Chromatiales bacterium]|nr:asparagine synthase (glutamine-hydrolyzing) [Chromatiales bacterium]HEX22442.1 asparagine synthase (glutamine-hydrolyzing) [Chromatiales bacterium]